MFSLNHVLSCATMSSFAAEKLALERRQRGASSKGEAYVLTGAEPSAHTRHGKVVPVSAQWYSTLLRTVR